MQIKIGTRGSKLALQQTRNVKAALEQAYPQDSFEIVIIKTKGDRILHKPLDQIGDKGLFVKEIEQQILDGTIDLGVHSMKDMPSVPEQGLVFAKTWKREDPRDALILRKAGSLEELPQGAVIATGSKRRKYQLLQLRSDLQVVGIRGNIDTRLSKMQAENMDGIILAAAGLHRLGLKSLITQYFDADQMIPAAAQGALALEVRASDEQLLDMLNRLSDADTDVTVSVEREFLHAVGGSCHIPVGALCEREGDRLTLHAVLGDEEGDRLHTITAQQKVSEGKELARSVAQKLMEGLKE